MADKEILELLHRIIANQTVLFRELEKIQEKEKGISSSKDYRPVMMKLDEEAKKVMGYIDRL